MKKLLLGIVLLGGAIGASFGQANVMSGNVVLINTDGDAGTAQFWVSGDKNGKAGIGYFEQTVYWQAGLEPNGDPVKLNVQWVVPIICIATPAPIPFIGGKAGFAAAGGTWNGRGALVGHIILDKVGGLDALATGIWVGGTSLADADAGIVVSGNIKILSK